MQRDLKLGERKVSYSGRSLAITLPKNWCAHHKLKRKSVLIVSMQDDESLKVEVGSV